jgi:hypothetical protein
MKFLYNECFRSEYDSIRACPLGAPECCATNLRENETEGEDLDASFALMILNTSMPQLLILFTFKHLTSGSHLPHKTGQTLLSLPPEL